MVAYLANSKSKYVLDQTVERASLGDCSNCGSRAVVVESEQLRSADEEATGVMKCLECGT